MRLRYLLIIFLIGVFAPTAHAQLSKEEKPVLGRATSKLKIAEGDMESIDQLITAGVLSDPILREIQKKTENAEKKLQEAEPILAGLNQSASEVKEATARLSKIRADLEAQKKKLKEGSAKIAEADAVWESTDLDSIDALKEKLDATISAFRSTDPDNIVLKNWPQLNQEVGVVLAKYKGAKAKSDKALKAEVHVKSLQKSYSDVEKSREMALGLIPDQLKTTLEGAQKAAKEAIEKGTFGQFLLLVDPALSRLEGYIAVYEVVSAGSLSVDLALIEKTKAAIVELRELEKKHEAKIIASNQPPADVYKAEDRSKLSALITTEVKSVNKDKLLAVKFVESEWRRSAGANWNASSLSWDMYDESHLDVAVIIASPDGKFGYMYHLTLVKKHLANDKILLVGSSISGRPAMPTNIIPIANVK